MRLPSLSTLGRMGTAQEKRVKKNSNPKVILDRNFMIILRPETFDHEPFRKGSSKMYSEHDIDRFDSEFRKQIHFNFAATRNTQKQKQSQEATRASRLRDIDLDDIERDTATVVTTNWSDLSWYVLEDILDCPPGSQFIVCIATNTDDVERADYYSKTATLIANDIRLAEGQVEYWKMKCCRYLVRQARLDQSSHYSKIKMKAVLSRQFLDAFNNEGGDFAFQFEGTPTRLTIPWCDIIRASNTVMIIGAPFSQGRSFP